MFYKHGKERAERREKSIIILTLGDPVMEKTRAIVGNDKKSARELLEKLRRLYTTSNHQGTTKLIKRLNPIFLKAKKEN